MKIIYVMVIVTVFVFGTTSVAYAQWEWGTVNVLVDGWKALQKIDAGNKDVGGAEYLRAGAYCGYIMGVLHVTADSYKILMGAPRKQIFAVVGKYLDEHPEKWSEHPSKIVYEALVKGFPK